MMKPFCSLTLCMLMSFSIVHAESSEVFTETKSQVIVRHHPKTGKAYASITSSEVTLPDPLFNPKVKQNVSRPDYRLLDPKVKSGQIPYDGPTTDNKKIYIFAASLATLGVGGGTLGLLFPAASTAAAGGAGIYGAGAVAVTAGTAATAYYSTKSDPKKDNFANHSESRTLEITHQSDEPQTNKGASV